MLSCGKLCVWTVALCCAGIVKDRPAATGIWPAKPAAPGAVRPAAPPAADRGGHHTLGSAGPCEIDCPPDSMLEGEPLCHDDYVDSYNGGCGSDPVVFSPIALGEPVCGESGTFLSGASQLRDTDWYACELTTPADLRWQVEAEFPVAIAIVGEGELGGCWDFEIIAFAFAAPCESATATAHDLMPGPYWLWVGPSEFVGVPCGSRYVARVDRDCPCDFNGDGMVDAADLAEVLGHWGLCPGCPQDTDADGAVGADDLALLLGQWGPCP